MSPLNSLKMFKMTKESSRNPNGPRKDSGKKSIGEKVQINIARITLTLGFVNKNRTPSDERSEGAFLIMLGSSRIERII